MTAVLRTEDGCPNTKGGSERIDLALIERIGSARLRRTQLNRIAVRIAYEELRIARAPAAVTDHDAHLAQLLFGRFDVANAERDVTVVTRRHSFQSERVFVKIRRAFDIGY